MLVVAITLGGGLAAGWLRGGRLANLGRVRVRLVRLLVAALAVQVVAGLLGPGDRAAPRAGAALAAVLAVCFLLGNRRLAGTGLVALGLAANALVVALNAGMPVSASAALRAGVPLAQVTGHDRHRLAGAGTRLGALGDVVALPLPGDEQVLSVGDLFVLAGVATLLAAGMSPAAAAGTGPSPRPAPAARRTGEDVRRAVGP